MTSPVTYGDRVRIIHWQVDKTGASTDPDTGLIRDRTGAVISVDDNVTVPPGTEGTVNWIGTDFDGKAWRIGVQWDNGSCLQILVGVDEWESVESAAL